MLARWWAVSSSVLAERSEALAKLEGAARIAEALVGGRAREEDASGEP